MTAESIIAIACGCHRRCQRTSSDRLLTASHLHSVQVDDDWCLSDVEAAATGAYHSYGDVSFRPTSDNDDDSDDDDEPRNDDDDEYARAVLTDRCDVDASGAGRPVNDSMTAVADSRTVSSEDQIVESDYLSDLLLSNFRRFAQIPTTDDSSTAEHVLFAGDEDHQRSPQTRDDEV